MIYSINCDRDFFSIRVGSITHAEGQRVGPCHWIIPGKSRPTKRRSGRYSGSTVGQGVAITVS